MRTEQFFGENYHYIWSNGWEMDGNGAWFMAGAMDVLFYFDKNTKTTKIVDKIPTEHVFELRQHPRCIQAENAVICLPDRGSDIWFYHFANGLWTHIPLENPDKVRVGCFNTWLIEEKLYMVSIGLKQIIELDTKKECIINYYDLPINTNENITESVMVNGEIYVAGVSPANIYKFNCLDKSIKIYNLSEINDLIQTICFDGNKFWLSGQQKNIYIWEESTEKITILDNFPKGIGIWNFSGKYKDLFHEIEDAADIPLFLCSVSAGRYIWFIPFQTNEIVYIDKDTYEMKLFSIEEEGHTEENISTQLLRHKYLLQYVRDDRYIGLFSLKNKWIFEVDSKELEYRILDYHLDKKFILQIEKTIFQDMMSKFSILFEQQSNDLENILESFSDDNKSNPVNKKSESVSNSIGKSIYLLSN
ncbi:hypothetical protein D3Z55_19305 [Clostridiaceae bacterium]|nr:hypothetical protein [Clostridiaceae bacterium]